jgi:hypothetical protein
MALTRPRLGQINTTVSNFTDPIVVFNAGSTVANVDQGILFNRANGLVANAALFFSESANSFVLGFTSNSGQTNSNIQITSNANLRVRSVFFESLFWANGNPFILESLYGNTNVAAYLDSQNITSANIGTIYNSLNTLDANVGAFQIYANANIVSITSDISSLYANAATQANILNVLSGNAVAQQSELASLVSNAASQASDLISLLSNAAAQETSLTTLTANAASQQLIFDTLSSNVGAYQIYANANASTQTTAINTLDANVGAFETYANTKIGTNSNSNLVVIATTESTSNVTGALVVQGGAGISGNVFANVLYTYQGIRWAGNGNVFASGGGGGTFTASTTAPVVANDGDFWYNTTSDILLQYLDDGTSEYWVDVQSPTLFANTATTTVLGETTITGNLVPSANITYSLGTTTQRFKDLFLSGTTIDLGGATIKTDADSGAIALIPLPTVENPNPTGIVVSPAGTISTVETSGGTVSGNAISSSANNAVTTGTTTFGNIVVSDNLTAANLTANSNVVANKITTTTGVFWSNGVAFSSGLSGAQVNARVWAQKIFWG